MAEFSQANQRYEWLKKVCHGCGGWVQYVCKICSQEVPKNMNLGRQPGDFYNKTFIF